MGENVVPGIRAADLATLSIYLAFTLGLGLWFGIRTKTTEGYFLGGRAMPGWAVGLSLLATTISSITFLAYPGSAYEGNYSRIVPGLTFPVGAIVAIFLFIPFYRKTGFVSAYTYFERRFGLWGRLYACILYSVLQVWRMGFILYLLAMAVCQLYPQWDLEMVILTIGVFVTVYTVLGGIEAVIWTDVLQTLALILGGFAVILVVFSSVDGGAWTVFSMGWANGKFSFVGQNAESAFDLSLSRDTLIMLLLVGSIGSIQEFALHQNNIQRYCAPSTDRAARRAAWTGGLGCIPVWLLFMFVGTCLWVFYQTKTAELPAGMLSDEVFPHFILYQLPAGLGGVVLAGVLAAAMSSIDSSMSATTSVVTEDIYKRILVPGRRDSHYLNAAKVIAALSGVIAIGIALGLTYLRQDTILDIAFIVGGMLMCGLGGLFFIGFFTIRGTSFGALVGILLAVVATAGMTWIEARAKIWESNESWLIEHAQQTGALDAAKIAAGLRAAAEADGAPLTFADLEKAKEKRMREIYAETTIATLGPRPPRMSEALGVHEFMMGVLSNLVAFVVGYCCSFFGHRKSIEELAGLTWWTRHQKRMAD